MSKLLFNEQPLVVDKELARLIGLNEAIVLQQVHYWISSNQKKNKNFFKNKYWVYNSISKWQEENFNFWSCDTVKRTFSKLVKSKILITDNFNKEKRDRTLWYSINYKTLEALKKSIGANCTNALGQNAPMDKGKMHQPLPETTTETTSIYNQSVSHIDTKCINTIDTIYNIGEFLEKSHPKEIKDYFWDRLIVNYTCWEKEDIKAIDEILINILEMFLSDSLVINKRIVSQALIRTALLKLTTSHIQILLQNFKDIGKKVKVINKKAYLQSCIYNIVFEYDFKIQTDVNYLLNNGGE